MHAIQHLSALAPLALAAFVQADPAAADAGAGMLGQQLVTGLSNGMIIALIAIGYTMVYGIIELINFAHGDLCTLGAFLALTVAGALGMELWSGVGGMAGVLLDAVRRAKTKDRAGILEAVAATKDFQGALGTWSFDENGDTTSKIMSGQTVDNGDFKFVKVLGK